MKSDSRLSSVLHLLLHMAEHKRPCTSEELAKMLRSNSVVVRRIMGGLRDQGLVLSTKGHGGGWSLACCFDQVTLLDIYQAINSPSLFAIGNRTKDPVCVVEQTVNDALRDALQEASEILLNRFATITLSQLHSKSQTQINRQRQRRRKCHE